MRGRGGRGRGRGGRGRGESSGNLDDELDGYFSKVGITSECSLRMYSFITVLLQNPEKAKERMDSDLDSYFLKRGESEAAEEGGEAASEEVNSLKFYSEINM